MDKNTMETIITKYIVCGLVTVFLLGLGTCAFAQHEDARARIEIETRKEEAAKAERDRAMFDGMNRAVVKP